MLEKPENKGYVALENFQNATNCSFIVQLVF